MTAPPPAIELRSIHKKFGKVAALSGASLRVLPGTLHMLLGENGAGKTTLLRVAAGLERPDGGSVCIGSGPERRWLSRREAVAAGVGIVQQHLRLIPTMTVAENVALAGPSVLARYSPADAERRVSELAAHVGLPTDPSATVGDLPVAGRQRAEIIKALAWSPSLLILDEPTAVLAPDESRALYTWLQSFVARGNAAVVITHHVREARTFGNAITVLRRGRTVFAAPQRGESEAEVIGAILGEAAPAHQRPAPRTNRHSHQPAAIILQAEAITATDAGGVVRIRDVSLAVHAGEVLGVAGVEGSGYRELLHVLAGRLPPLHGRVRRPDTLGFIPEDRPGEAIIGSFTLAENYALHGLGGRTRRIAWPEEARRAEECLVRAGIRDATSITPAGTLSGGSQQRFVVARELADAPSALVAENPARGLDIRATAEMLQLLRAHADAGAAVIIYSGDIDDLLAIADRVVACHDGRIVDAAMTRDAIGAAIIGAV